MSRTQQAEHSSVSPDKHSNLRQIHERLVDFIAAQVALSKATLRLADSIVDFYAPEDDGFAPAVAFQTMAADGTSGLLCAQLQALTETALLPLARHTAELSEIDALAKACKRKGESEHHYATKVKELNLKLETERKEDRRNLLQGKAARNINKLKAARRDREEASERLYRLMVSYQQSDHACFNPVLASICQFQEASYSHGHLLSSMLLRVVRSSLGVTSLPMTTAAADARDRSISPSPTRASSSRPVAAAASPVQESDAEGVLVWRDDGGGGGGRGHEGSNVNDNIDGNGIGNDSADITIGNDDGIGKSSGIRNDDGNGDENEIANGDVISCRVGNRTNGCNEENDDVDDEDDDDDDDDDSGFGGGQGCEAGGGEGGKDKAATPPENDDDDGSAPGRAAASVTAAAATTAVDGPGNNADPCDKARVTVETNLEIASTAAGGRPLKAATESAITGGQVAAAPEVADSAPPPPYEALATAAGVSNGGIGGEGGVAPATHASHMAIKAGGVSGGSTGGENGGAAAAAEVGQPREGFLEAHLPWGKRRRMSGNLRWKISGGGRSARQMFCATEGRTLVTYDTEGDANAGLPPRARYLVLGARSLWTGRNTADLEATVADETELMTLGWNQHSAPGLPFVDTRCVTLTAPGRHEHARWALALEETRSWGEEIERDALLEELELSLPFRESSLEFVRHNISDHRIEDILGVTAARNHPACVLKSSVFDAAAAAAALTASGSTGGGGGVVCFSSPEQTINAGLTRSSSARRASGASSTSFRRGLLSIFDSAKSPRGNGGDDASGGFSSSGGKNGGGGAPRRWGRSRSSGKKRRDAAARGGGGGGASNGGVARRRMRSGGAGSGDASPFRKAGMSWHGGPARGRRSVSNGSLGGGGKLDPGTPLRRRSAGESNDMAGWGLDYLGDFVGGGHALCRCRSRSVNGVAPDIFHLDSEHSAINQRRARFPSRERSLILEFVQEASGSAHHPQNHHYYLHDPAATATIGVGSGRHGHGTTSSAAASGTGTETGAESSVPSSPRGDRLASGVHRFSSSRWIDSSSRRASSHRTNSHRASSHRANSYRASSYRASSYRASSRRASSHHAGSHRRDSSSNPRYGSASTLAGGGGGGSGWNNPTERSILGVPALAVGPTGEASAPPSVGFSYSECVGTEPEASGRSGDQAAPVLLGSDARNLSAGEAGASSESLPSLARNVVLSRRSGINPYLARRPVSVSSHPSNTTAACQEVLFDPVRGGAGSAVAAAANGSEYANAPDQDDDRVLPIKVWGVWLNKDEMPALPRNNYATAVGGGTAAVASAESAADEIDTNEKDHDGVGPGVRRNGGLFVHESMDQVAAAPEDAGDAARSADEAIADASGGGAARNAEPLQSEGKAASYNVGDVPETGRPMSGLFRNRFRRVSIDPDGAVSLDDLATGYNVGEGIRRAVAGHAQEEVGPPPTPPLICSV